MIIDGEYYFIPCDRQLPPTECPLVIEVPPGTKFYDGMYEGSYWVNTNWGELRAHRVNHIETKERDMRFELTGRYEGNWVIGRFPWTYP